MVFRAPQLIAIVLALATPLAAETVEVQMLNKSDSGKMVFEPSFVKLTPGDTIVFRVIDKGHNAATIKGMIPEGATAFNGKINAEIEASFPIEGWYGIQCVPHYAMGMVLTVQVGDSAAPEHPHGQSPHSFADVCWDAVPPGW
jgi:pseudoazurin